MKNSVRRDRLTNSSDETNISSLISGDSVFVIPYFQRPYKWKVDRLKQFEQDILDIVDEVTDFHFLGAVIIHGRKSNPADPTPYEVIDGQQRLTTMFLYIAAAIKLYCQNDRYDEASSLFFKYLIVNRPIINLSSNYKLHSCKEDRAQLNFVFEDLYRDKKFKEIVDKFKITPLASVGNDTGILRNNYKTALRFFKNQLEQGGTDRLNLVFETMLQKMSVVQIDVYDPTDGPKIFDSLNSRQEPMTIGDLVRNEIFSKVANQNPKHVDIIDQQYWQPFYKKFKAHNQNQFDNYFFPFGLVKNPNLKKSEVYNYLRDSWKKIEDPQIIISELKEYQDAFMDLANGMNYQNHNDTVRKAINDLYFLNAPTSTFPFLMQLSNSIKIKDTSEKDGIEILDVIESFLVRRAVCGIEPTGLHAVFKKLWNDCDGKIKAKVVEEQIRKHKTVTWPDDELFEYNILNRGIYGSSICNYFIRKYDKSLGGDSPENIPWIEHILPVSPDETWFKVFTKDQHDKLKNLSANLIPLSEEMNIGIGNKEYAIKQERYLNDSMFKSARELAKNYQEWTPNAIKKRAEEIAEWALKKWKH